jgi:hypothetical protein
VLLRKRSDLTAAERAATVPQLDPRRHDALPPPAGWPKRTRAAAGRWVRRLRGRMLLSDYLGETGVEIGDVISAEGKMLV